jgi:hypothetical protein
MNIIERINEEVSIYDLFDQSDPPVKYLTKAKPCQISCPFHGNDTHPSARVYPDTNSLRCFYCSKSWRPVTFWAERNGWFREDDIEKLDIGRAIDSLATMYNINVQTFDWQKKFYALQKQDEARHHIPISERLDLRTYYAWEISKRIGLLSKDERKVVRDGVVDLWIDLDNTRLDSAGWAEDLKNWYGCAKLKLNVSSL